MAATTTTPATTINPEIIIVIKDKDNISKGKENDDDNNNDNNNEGDNLSENTHPSIPGENEIDKEATDAASTLSLLSATTTLLSCAFCLMWTR